MKVIILAGGKGTRIAEESQYKPKPMIMIGNKPIIWHIMKIYSQYNFKEFVITIGYKGQSIKDYFVNYQFIFFFKKQLIKRAISKILNNNYTFRKIIRIKFGSENFISSQEFIDC